MLLDSDIMIEEDAVESDQLLTTDDNPWNPFTHYDEWYVYDMQQGYNTCGLLARYTTTSDELSELDNLIAIRKGMLAVVALNPFGIHRIVYKNEQDKTKTELKTQN